MCGKCILDPSTWSKICFSNTYCQDGGLLLTKYLFKLILTKKAPHCSMHVSPIQTVLMNIFVIFWMEKFVLLNYLLEEHAVMIICVNVINVNKFCIRQDQINHQLVSMCVRHVNINAWLTLRNKKLIFLRYFCFV